VKTAHPLVASATILAAGLAASGAAASAPPAPDAPHRSVSKLAAPVGNHSQRWEGADRYTTAAEVSRSAGWDEGNAVTVYLATGTNYPDALAVGASAGDGPLLLVKGGDMTEATRGEIRRLYPCHVVAVGGSDVVPDAVVLEADSYTAPATYDKCTS
jgi:putative cell wall-binding protein